MDNVSEEVPVPLSEEERKRLAELEQELVKNDPGLAQELKSGKVRFRQALLVAAGLIAVVGMLLIVVGILTQLVIVGVLGFTVMGAAAYWIVSKRHPRGQTR
jgi:uncharacterized membrane protein YphA (DoxX/SURF4 family)